MSLLQLLGRPAGIDRRLLDHPEAGPLDDFGDVGREVLDHFGVSPDADPDQLAGGVGRLIFQAGPVVTISGVLQFLQK